MSVAIGLFRLFDIVDCSIHVGKYLQDGCISLFVFGLLPIHRDICNDFFANLYLFVGFAILLVEEFFGELRL